MTQSPVAQRYARALFELAQEQGLLDAVQGDFTLLKELGKDRAQFERLTSRYELTPENMATLWKALFKDHVNPLTLRFLLFLASKGRGPVLGEVVRAFDGLCDDSRGILAVEVISAKPLPEDQLRGIVAQFEKRLQKTLRATTRVEPSLLGGFQVRVRDTIYDFSVNHQLEQLQQATLTV